MTFVPEDFALRCEMITALCSHEEDESCWCEACEVRAEEAMRLMAEAVDAMMLMVTDMNMRLERVVDAGTEFAAKVAVRQAEEHANRPDA